MSEVFWTRLERLRGELASRDLEALIVSSPSNIFYLSGFRGSSGALLITQQQALLFSDFRYCLQAMEQAPDYEFMEAPRRLLARVGEVATEQQIKRLGYDSEHLTCAQREEVGSRASAAELIASPGIIETLRAVKYPAEIQKTHDAARLADHALAHMVTLLQPGAVEREIALEGEFIMRRAGAEAAAFNIIVASGPRSALPHAQTTDRELQKGDLVVIDIGAKMDGYCSDMTRTFAIQSASAQAREIYELVYRTQKIGVNAALPGAKCGEVDAVARNLITEAGFGEYFGHGLGHGVGIDVHEEPRLRPDEESLLAPGNVITIEPGVYIPELGGVRLENMMVVREESGEILTGSPMSATLPEI